ncbi:flagellar motor switch protein FliG [Buchnera aphidicola (Muscaphis stroyani)]|uniref:Flagellar motor switch protein FliG n=1 Tax=Buchnera aphidicola (Muscaphis stroyani) TaxID=1241869 RepID=A0A4D6Y3Z8_9GAMM|nr:flagellar motor switch protein FliG [Buchnera aphidicola]QCI24182.1 flagellar motor switch protein FliG [Buchnera aphidicola (Muscaphis stroyani)]
MILNGIEKSALLLMSIGSDQSAEILKNLTPFEVQELTNAMVNIKQCSSKTLTTVLHECYDLAEKYNTISCNSEDYLNEMLTKALGGQQGHLLLKETIESRNIQIYIESLNIMNSEKIAFLLREEHSQIIATILIHLKKSKSASILSLLSRQKRAEIILKISEFKGIEESSLIKLTQVIENLLKRKKLIFSEKGGMKIAAGILNSMKIEHEKNTLQEIRVKNQELANAIVKEMFSFENIINLEDKYIQYIVKNVEKEKLCIALYNSSQVVKNKFLDNMSKEESNKFKLNLEKKSYVSDESIKNEQKLIFIVIKHILDNGNTSLEKLGKYYA